MKMLTFFLTFLLIAFQGFGIKADEKQQNGEESIAQFVDGHPVAPAHSMFEDIQAMLADQPIPDEGDKSGENATETEM